MSYLLIDFRCFESEFENEIHINLKLILDLVQQQNTTVQYPQKKLRHC
jgi:hypothetical protein